MSKVYISQTKQGYYMYVHKVSVNLYWYILHI